tara:strand:+ start:2766 stop:2945 length:180 start_codon:yes stop_codon:yes gene_type:complete
MMYHTTIDAHMEVNFALLQHHHWSLSDIESLIPWEREVYVKYLSNFLEKQKLEIQNANG